MAEQRGEHNYPAYVEDDETMDASIVVPTTDSSIMTVATAMPGDRHGFINLQLRQHQEDLMGIEQHLSAIGIDEEPPNLHLTFYHATVVYNKELLSEQHAADVDRVKAALGSLVLIEGGENVAAIIGSLDISLRSANDFLAQTFCLNDQLSQCAERSGIVFVCLSEQLLSDGWLKRLQDDALVSRADVVAVFLDEESRKSHGRGSDFTPLTFSSESAMRSVSSLLQRCVPRRRKWLTSQQRKLELWRKNEAAQRMRAEQEDAHQHDEAVRQLQRQHGVQVGDDGIVTSPVTTGAVFVTSPASAGGASRNSYFRPAARSVEELVRLNCIQKPVKCYFDGLNFENLCRLKNPGIVLLYGLRGVGKTQLALRYAQQLKETKPAFVYLFHFDTDEAFAADVASLSELLGVEHVPGGLLGDRFCRVVEVLLSTRYEGAHKLLILDGAEIERVEYLLGKTSLLEKLHDGRADLQLILTATTRKHYESAHSATIELLPVDPLNCSQVEQVMADDPYFGGQRGTPVSDCVSRLCRELSGLPLGIFPALAYMRRTHCTLTSYLDQLDEPHVVEEHKSFNKTYSQTVLQAIRLAINELFVKCSHSYSMKTMVFLVACFARHELPIDLIRCCLSLRAPEGNSVAGEVNSLISELEAMCLFEKDSATYKEISLVTVHKVVHSVMFSLIPSPQVADTLDLALRGLFLILNLDTRRRAAREYAILVHPHATRLAELADEYYDRLSPRAKLCLVHLLTVSAYLCVEAGEHAKAAEISTQALDKLCALLDTSKESVLTGRNHGNDADSPSFAQCPLAGRLDRLAAAADMTPLLCRRRAPRYDSDDPHQPLPMHMDQSSYEQLVAERQAIDLAAMRAIFPYELLASVLYLYGRSLMKLEKGVAEESFHLSGLLCKHVNSVHGVHLIYALLSQRSGLLMMIVSDNDAAPSSLHDVVGKYEALALDGHSYFQMGLLKMQPNEDIFHKHFCKREIVKSVQRLHLLAVSCGDVQGARAARLQGLRHCDSMLLLARESDAAARSSCYVVQGHFTLQTLPPPGGASQALSCYGRALSELLEHANLPVRIVTIATEVVDAHYRLVRLPDEKLFNVLTSYIDRAKDTCSATKVDEAKNKIESLRAVLKIGNILNAVRDGMDLLSKTFDTAAPSVAHRAGCTTIAEQAFAWREVLCSEGYTDTTIIGHCKQLLRQGLAGQTATAVEGGEYTVLSLQ